MTPNKSHFFAAVIALGALLSVDATSRSISLKNSCAEKVRVGFTAGAIPNTACSTDGNCPANGRCSKDAGLCFYPSFLPEGHLDLNPSESSTFSTYIGSGGMYSGAIFASTGCDSYLNACETGICRNKACDQFTGAVGPHTRAEFTFNPTGVDFYDISLMHGINVPISMKPSGGNRVLSDPYSCKSAGSISADGDLPGCSYKYNAKVNNQDHTANVVFVAPTNLTSLTYCSSSAQCGDGLVCGLSAGRDPTGLQTTQVDRVCGKSVGLWSADEVCIYSAGAYSAEPYKCTNKASQASYTDLYGCAGAYAHSGYQPNQPASVTCGCYDWPWPSESACKSKNPEWLDVVLPWVTFIKEVCPMAYSYAFDDMTSTFTCGGADIDYEVEFCPGGVNVSPV